MFSHLGKQAGTLAMSGLFVSTQIVTRPFDWWASRRIRLHVHIPHGLRVPHGTLVIANHRSMLDPFLITHHLERPNWFVPIRAPMTPTYARMPIVGHTLKALGAYDVGKTTIERAKKLLFTRDILRRGHTVLLFPEGKIVDHGAVVQEFKDGAKMLFAEDYPTLFVQLSGFSTLSFIHPKTVVNARMRFSSVVRGDTAAKLAYMEKFFSADES